MYGSDKLAGNKLSGHAVNKWHLLTDQFDWPLPR
jgi:hypothetical protein